MTSSFIDILGIKISRLGLNDVIQACEDRITQKQGGYVCLANVHTVTESTEHPELQTALNEAFLAVADGVPLVWTSRLKGEPVETRVCGPDLLENWLNLHRETLVGFIGGAPGRAETIAQRFGVQAICYSSPVRPFSRENALEDWETFLKLCPKQKPPSVVWMGLGAPKQELWMNAVSPHAPETLFFGVGAAFDFLAGAKSRAPKWMQKSGLEWFYRMSQEPGRLAKRYLVTNSMFTYKIARMLLFSKKSPSKNNG